MLVKMLQIWTKLTIQSHRLTFWLQKNWLISQTGKLLGCASEANAAK